VRLCKPSGLMLSGKQLLETLGANEDASARDCNELIVTGICLTSKLPSQLKFRQTYLAVEFRIICLKHKSAGAFLHFHRTVHRFVSPAVSVVWLENRQTRGTFRAEPYSQMRKGPGTTLTGASRVPVSIGVGSGPQIGIQKGPLRSTF
jgi:hypothetical protein